MYAYFPGYEPPGSSSAVTTELAGRDFVSPDRLILYSSAGDAASVIVTRPSGLIVQ